MKVCDTIIAYGAAQASEAELLATMLRKPDKTRAESILARVGGFVGLALYSAAELGLSPSEFARVQAAHEWTRRVASSKLLRIRSPREAGAHLLPLCAGWTEERFGMIALNCKGNALGMRILSRGTATATLISPREFFRAALGIGASSALAFHNHPSGDPAPSGEDIQLTRRLRAAGESLGVPLADHLIIGSDTFYSFHAGPEWEAINTGDPYAATIIHRNGRYSLGCWGDLPEVRNA